MDITKDKELVTVYKKEARELLGVMREAIASRKSGRDKRAVYRLFRSCHTLKEISGCMGYKDIEKMAGELLDISRLIKDGKEGTTSLLRERINTCQGLLRRELR